MKDDRIKLRPRKERNVASRAKGTNNEELIMSNTVILVDSHSFLYRYYHTPTTKEFAPYGEDTKVIYAFINMVRTLSAAQSSHLIFCFDGKTDLLTRKIIYPGYKEGRHIDKKTGKPKDRSDLFKQIKVCKQVLDCWNIRWYEGIKDEADDLLATLHTKARKAGKDVQIISVDKDMYQLIDDQTVCRDVMGMNIIDNKEVLRKMGVPASQMEGYLIMVGDTVDKVPGIRGVGEVKAKQLLKEFGSWKAIKKAVPDLPGTVKAKFEQSDIPLMEKLIKLNKNVKIVRTSIGKSKCLLRNGLHQPVGLNAIQEIANEYGFYDLLV